MLPKTCWAFAVAQSANSSAAKQPTLRRPLSIKTPRAHGVRSGRIVPGPCTRQPRLSKFRRDDIKILAKNFETPGTTVRFDTCQVKKGFICSHLGWFSDGRAAP